MEAGIILPIYDGRSLDSGDLENVCYRYRRLLVSFVWFGRCVIIYCQKLVVFS